MFKFSELTQIHLEITNNCQASCPMCNRNINGGLENPLIKINGWSLEDFKKVMTPDVLHQLDSFYFCGNFGDPMLNNDLVEMCRYSTQVSPNTRIAVHTNGGARNKEWWQSLAQALPKNHRVVFALDGLKDTHSLYRVGTDFDKVIDNALSFIQAGGTAEWVFIKFKHNEHQVEQVRQMAKDLGFHHFTLKNSSRFILEPRVKVLDKTGSTTHYIEPATDVPLKFINKKVIQDYKDIVSKSVISCKSKHEKEIYIDAYGDVLPCCWLASVPYTYVNPDDALEVRQEMLKQHHEMVDTLGNINCFTKPIKDIIESNEYQSAWDEYWTTNKLITCARTCGTNTEFAKPRDQIVNEN
jgi:MoaA/NifB/PqqE/SkfB family radical SAM enzyme